MYVYIPVTAEVNPETDGYQNATAKCASLQLSAVTRAPVTVESLALMKLDGTNAASRMALKLACPRFGNLPATMLTPKDNTTFCAVSDDYSAYGLLDHRHTPEMEQVLGASVLFTPHLAPMSRGILATCYARPTGPTSTDALLEALRAAYADEPFVVVTDGSPSTKATLGSNCAHVTARYDERTGWVLAIGAIDNLTKGASGAAVQCANLLLGLPETAGLPIAGVYP